MLVCVCFFFVLYIVNDWFLSLVIPLSYSSYSVWTHALQYANAALSFLRKLLGVCDKETQLHEGCSALSGLLTNQNVVLLTNLK